MGIANYFKKSDIDSYSRKENKRIKSIVDKIESLKGQVSILSDQELSQKTKEFQFRLKTGETLDEILPEAFAVVREADARVLGKEPYKVQLIGGIILHQGRVAELKTGEGKTLLGTLPAYLNALTGQGVHIVTVNEYLALRDSSEMRKVYEFLGLSVGCVLSSMTKVERQKQYACDITYVTNSEVGFDYLRDNLVESSNDRVQRGLVYAIIDEVDSVLIDESRTPLIISNSSGKNSLFYGSCNLAAKRLVKGEVSGKFNKMEAILGKVISESGDFIVDEKDHIVTLTQEGLSKAERFLHIQNLTAPENSEFYHGLLNALRANYLMVKGRDYIVKNGEVLIVDTFTGRVMEGRRFSDGLHQAIEAKERVKIQKEMDIQAAITYQNFFNKYKKKCGMTGTGKTEEREFREIYYLDVVQIPTHKPVARIDKSDLVYLTKEEKFKAIVEAVIESYDKHRPVLIGTTDINTSDYVSSLLSEKGIPHTVLNAKNDALEADIISKAGRVGAVTVATNMAGRGTDIQLSDESKKLGGLKVIGTERHENRRIDNQLIGRSGRQGDPGESQFFLSLEDDLMKYFGRDSWIKKFQSSHSQGPIFGKRIDRLVKDAQENIENSKYSLRRQIFEFDAVDSEHREVIYALRNSVLESDEMSNVLEKFILDYAKSENQAISEILPDLSQENVDQYLIQFLEKQTSKFSNKEFNRYTKSVCIHSIDKYWKNHIEEMSVLRKSVNFHSYGQKDPKVEYHKIGSLVLKETLSKINREIFEAIASIA